MIITAIVILPFIYVDVSVQARGYFQSETEKQLIYTPFQGKVYYSSVKNGIRVTKGDTLLIIDSETINARKTSILQRIAENNASIHDLGILTSLDSSCNLFIDETLNTLRYRAEFDNLRNQQSIQHQKYQKKKTEHERNQLLYKQDIIPVAEFENSLFMVTSERDNLSQILLYQESIWQNDLTVRRNDSVSLYAGLKECNEELANRIVLSPVSGEIIQSADIQPGSVVSPGQKIADISPDGELVATCFLRPADIGLVHENQKVRIQVDAFNHNEWGMLDGDIIDISDDMIIENGTAAFFRVRCRPSKTFLTLKNGYRANIKKGMSLNTRIVVIRRSLYNLLFDKADKWFNPYTYKTE